MTRSQIEYVLALDKLRNFSKAADHCFITQSTLSTMVAKYEAQIGVKIFDRKTKPIGLSSEGVEIVKSLKSIYREMQMLDEKIENIKGLENSNLSIACIPTVAPYLYPLILNKVSGDHSKVNLSVSELTTERTIEEILAGNVDIGIVSTPLDHPELKEQPLYHEDFLLFDCGESMKQKGYKVTEIDLDRLWLLEEGHCMRNQVGKICELRQQKKINGNITYSCGSIYTLIEMVKKNKGVTLIPRLALARNKQIDKKKIYELSSPAPIRQIGIITHKNFIKNTILSYLVETIRAAVKTHLRLEQFNHAPVRPFSESM